MITKCPFCKKKMEPIPNISTYGISCRCMHGAIKSVLTASGDGDVKIRLQVKGNPIIVECYYRGHYPIITGGKELYFNAGIIKDNTYTPITYAFESKSLQDYLGSLNAEEVYNRFIKLANLS